MIKSTIVHYYLHFSEICSCGFLQTFLSSGPSHNTQPSFIGSGGWIWLKNESNLRTAPLSCGGIWSRISILRFANITAINHGDESELCPDGCSSRTGVSSAVLRSCLSLWGISALEGVFCCCGWFCQIICSSLTQRWHGCRLMNESHRFGTIGMWGIIYLKAAGTHTALCLRCRDELGAAAYLFIISLFYYMTLSLAVIQMLFPLLLIPDCRLYPSLFVLL